MGKPSPTQNQVPLALLGEKLVKMLWFGQNWIFGQKFDFSNSVTHPGDGAGIDWVLHLVQTLDPEGLGGMKQGWKELLRHIDFTSVGKFQHGRGFISASVFQNNDRVFARGCL